MKTSSSASIPADIRQVIVRSLGAALAEAWRRKHLADRVAEGDEVREGHETGEVQPEALKTSPAAV